MDRKTAYGISFVLLSAVLSALLFSLSPELRAQSLDYFNPYYAPREQIQGQFCLTDRQCRPDQKCVGYSCTASAQPSTSIAPSVSVPQDSQSEVCDPCRGFACLEPAVCYSDGNRPVCARRGLNVPGWKECEDVSATRSSAPATPAAVAPAAEEEVRQPSVQAINRSCSIDSDCSLEVPSILLECNECDAYDCRMYDGADEKVSAVNKNWQPACPPKDPGRTCVQCAGGIQSGNYSAICVNNTCQKAVHVPPDDDDDGGGDDDGRQCSPIACDDGRTFPTCGAEGYPINYFQNPCNQPVIDGGNTGAGAICGNDVCEEGEADEYDPGGCGPDAPPECLGPPAQFKPGTCPQDCEGENDDNCHPTRFTCNGEISMPPCNSEASEIDCSYGGKKCDPDTGSCISGNDDDACPPTPDCVAPPQGCSYPRFQYDDNNCLIGCGPMECEGDDDDDDDDESYCGNGIVDTGEECDDGGRKPGDGCSPDCKEEYCGDGVVSVGEECDDGHTSGDDGCNPLCQYEYCGDGKMQASLGEQCDDGNSRRGDGCDENCQEEEGGGEPVCGNGVVEPGEECDDGKHCIDGRPCESGDDCPFKHVEPLCAPRDGDKCSSECEKEYCYSSRNCEGGTVCTVDTIGDCQLDPFCPECDVCTGLCVPPSQCGNGEVDPDEECDDGNNNNEDECTDDCRVNHAAAPECGNGEVEEGEECDDGNVNDEDECNNDCEVNRPSASRCGNGEVEGDEECDDGNRYNQDGCNVECQKDTALQPLTGVCEPCSKCDETSAGCYVHTNPYLDPIVPSPACIQSPSTYFSTTYPWKECRRPGTCGNGKLEGQEECDDGNTKDGDGCSAGCFREPSYYCRSCEGITCSGNQVCTVSRTAPAYGGNPTCRDENRLGVGMVACKACGNGRIDPGEECDDGNTVNTDACTNSCTNAVCGDEVVWNGHEWCDDGNRADGDGCGSACQDCPCSPACPEDEVCYVSLVGKDPFCRESTPTGTVSGGYWDICRPTPAPGSIAVTVQKVPVQELDKGRYNYSIENKGNNTVYGVSLFIPWPHGLTEMSSSSGCSRTPDNQGVICYKSGTIVQPGEKKTSWVLFTSGGNICPKIYYTVTAEARVNNNTYKSNELRDWMWCTQSLPRCGNKKVEQGEECDDGNNVNSDQCTNACKNARCGDGIVQPVRGEQCDDGNVNNLDGCNSTCKMEGGGGGGGGDDDDGGSERCATYQRGGDMFIRVCATCGNSACEPYERCTPSSCAGTVCTSDCGPLYCPADCESPAGGGSVGGGQVCGNRIREGTEQCDDGNRISGDGCDSNCRTEAILQDCSRCHGITCPLGEACFVKGTLRECFAPNQGQGGWKQCSSVTTQLCGNRIREGTEQCDDGNRMSGDGCDSNCRTEPTAQDCSRCQSIACPSGSVCHVNLQGQAQCRPLQGADSQWTPCGGAVIPPPIFIPFTQFIQGLLLRIPFFSD